MASEGKNIGFQRVLTILGSITDTLKLNPSASQSLRQKYMQKGWLAFTANPTEEELVKLVLGRIQNDANQYEVFVTMLRDIAGMDLIVEKLAEPGSNDDGQQSRERQKYIKPAAHRPLTGSDLNDLLTIISSAAANWRLIGLGLGFTQGELDIIAATPANSGPVQCLVDLLSRWLNRAPPQHKRATVEDLMEALRSPTVGEGLLAVKLDEKMKTRAQN